MFHVDLCWLVSRPHFDSSLSVRWFWGFEIRIGFDCIGAKHISYCKFDIISLRNRYYPILWHIDLPVVWTLNVVVHIASLFSRILYVTYIDNMRQISIRMIDTQIFRFLFVFTMCSFVERNALTYSPKICIEPKTRSCLKV